MNEIALFPLWVTVFITIWALVVPLIGTLGGVLIGHYLTRSWQREQWVADNRKEEYRELLKDITLAATVSMEYKGTPGVRTPEEKKRYLDAYNGALRCLTDRMFIAEEIHKINVFGRWTKAMLELSTTNDVHRFSDQFDQLRNDILASALQKRYIDTYVNRKHLRELEKVTEK